MSRGKRESGVIFLITILVILVDQFFKIVLSSSLALNESVPVIKNLFHLTLVHNTGIAFGLFKGSSSIILVVTILGLVLIAYHFKRNFFISSTLEFKATFLEKLAVGFVLGGAVGNMIDRFRLGYVIDFLDFRIWPVFNMADSCITIGATILLIKTFIPAKSH